MPKTLVNTPNPGECTILVQLYFSGEDREYLAEFTALAESAGANVAAVIESKRQKPEPKYFIGKGKALLLAEQVKQHQAELVIVNHPLSPGQASNLEKLIECRVIDYTGLILDIFARRAKTFEGKLQVELAQLHYHASRLVRVWTHLERQRGGKIGMTGPGETQLELDRRLIRGRIKHIQKRLSKVQSQRELGRRLRRKSGLPTIALVGYTNAGKSTLFNALTDENVYVKDQLFATLDPTLRQMVLPGCGKVVIADTVGFIRRLPHDLVAAFRATLEEVVEADLLLHVVDAKDPDHQMRINEVNIVLKSLGVENKATILVYNKLDLLNNQLARIDSEESGLPYRVWVSAVSHLGFEVLFEAIAKRLNNVFVDQEIKVKPEHAKFRAALFECGAVKSEQALESGELLMGVWMSGDEFDRLCQIHHIDPDTLH